MSSFNHHCPSIRPRKTGDKYHWPVHNPQAILCAFAHHDFAPTSYIFCHTAPLKTKIFFTYFSAPAKLRYFSENESLEGKEIMSFLQNGPGFSGGKIFLFIFVGPSGLPPTTCHGRKRRQKALLGYEARRPHRDHEKTRFFTGEKRLIWTNFHGQIHEKLGNFFRFRKFRIHMRPMGLVNLH